MTLEQDYGETATDGTYEDRFNGQGEFKGQKMNRNLRKAKHGCAEVHRQEESTQKHFDEYLSKHHN